RRRSGARRRRRRARVRVPARGARVQETLMTDRVVDISNLTVRYGRIVAVDNVSIGIDRGIVYALLGRNGAGKSSIIRCLLGQRRADSGSVRLFDEDAWSHRAALMQRVGVVSEESDAPPEM